MSFLTPIPALIAAALAVPALLLLYFLRLRRRPVRVSTTMFWDQAVRDLQVNVPWRMIRPSWLLLLQLLALASLLVAFARPIVKGRGPEATRLIMLIDASASMGAMDGRASAASSASAAAPSLITRLEQAKARAGELIDRALEGDSGVEIAVVSMAGSPQLVQPLTSDRRTLVAAIDSIEQTDQPADFAQALSLCGSIIPASEDESTATPPTAIHLLSDGAFASLPDGRGFVLAGAMLRYEPMGPLTRTGTSDDPWAEGAADEAAEGNAASASALDNLGIVALSARREPSDPSSVRVFARVQNAGVAVSSSLILTLDGREIRRQALELPARGGDGRPGQAVATFVLPSSDSGTLRVRIDRPDALACDNEGALVLSPRRPTRVLLVVPDAPNSEIDETRTGPHWIIADVLRELPGLTLRQAPISAYAASNPQDLSADLVIFDRVTPPSLPPVPTIHFGAIPTLRSGPEPASPPLLQAGEPEAAPTPVLTWSRTHPVMRDVSLDAVQIESARPLSWPVRTGESPIPWTFDELARGATGPIIAEITERRQGVSPIVRLVTGFELARSTWPLSPSFAIFLASAVEYLGPTDSAALGRSWQTRDPISIEVASPGQITLEGPMTLSASVPTTRAGTGEARRVATFPPPSRAGVYRVSASPASMTAVRELAVNLFDDLESGIEVRPSVVVNGTSAGANAESASPRELWPMFVLLAGALLVLEWVLSAIWMRV